VLSNFTNCFYGRRSNNALLVKGLHPRRRFLPASMIGAAQLIMIEEIDGLKFWKVTLGDIAQC